MMHHRNKGFPWLLVAFLVFALPLDAKKREPLTVQAGATIPTFGFVLDASYDPRLDILVPGYKIVTVALRNASLDVIYLDPQRDRWEVQDHTDKWTRAVTALNQSDSKTWNALPERLRQLLGYPLAIPIGATQPIDLFIPSKVDLTGLKALRFQSAAFGQTFHVLLR